MAPTGFFKLGVVITGVCLVLLGNFRVCEGICGDGIVDAPEEECDDQGSQLGDGCDGRCLIEKGWGCMLEPSRCSRIDWVPPIGIPYPDSIEASHLMYANETFDYSGTPGSYKDSGNGPFTHYVRCTPNLDGGCDGCSDAEEFGDPESPRCSIPQDLKPGTVVEVHGGPYTQSTGWNSIYLEAHGTLPYPIFIRGIGSPMVRFDIQVLGGPYRVLGCDHIVVENINMTKLTLGAPVKHFTLRHSEVTSNNLDGGVGCLTSGGAEPNSSVENVLIYDTKVHNNGDLINDYDQDRHGIGIVEIARNIWVVDCEVSYNSGNGMQINAGNWRGHLIDGVYIGRNHMHNNGQGGVGVKQSSNVIISQNKFNSVRNQDIGSVGDGASAQYSPQNLWFIFNEAYDSDYGLRMSSSSGGDGDNVSFIGNVIYDIHHSQFTLNSQGDFFDYDPTSAWHKGNGIEFYNARNQMRYILHNTIHDVDGGIVAAFSTTTGGLFMSNNLISNVNSLFNATNNHLNIEQVTTSLLSDFRFNFLQGDGRIRWGRSTLYNLQDFESLYPLNASDNMEGPLSVVNSPEFCTRLRFLELFEVDMTLGTQDGVTSVTSDNLNFEALGVHPGDRVNIEDTDGIECSRWAKGASCNKLIIKGVSGNTVTITRNITLLQGASVKVMIYYYPFTSPLKLYLPGEGSRFSIGDHIEYDHDGVVRTVLHISSGNDSQITFDPPLAQDVAPVKSICNWKEKTNYKWDLRPIEGSATIDSGTDHPAYDRFFDLYGIDIKKDFNGSPRGQGAWDMGAFEFTTGVPTQLTQPTIPTQASLSPTSTHEHISPAASFDFFSGFSLILIALFWT